MDMFKPEIYTMSSYDNGYLHLLDDLSGQMFGETHPSAVGPSTSTAQPSPFDMPWLTSDSASTSEEPSSPFSATGISPMSPRDDEESFSESSSTSEALVLPSIDPMPVDAAHFQPVNTVIAVSLGNPKKRARDAEILEAMPQSKVAKLNDDQPFSSTLPGPMQPPQLPLVSTVDGATGLQSLLAQQYSWNQLQIQQVMAYLNPLVVNSTQLNHQIQQALTMVAQPPSEHSELAPIASMFCTGPVTEFSDVTFSAEAVHADLITLPKKSTKKKNSTTSAAGTAAASKKRPKLDPKKDALQCLGHNRKKNKQCGNAALMEFIGPRPLYCAEHIDQDPTSLYTKCNSTHHLVSGEGKGCREVVLKELNCCHKHFDQITALWPLTPAGLATARSTLARVTEILELLEGEAAAAKKSDPDLFQRKHKIIPKFVQIIRQIEQWILDARAGGLSAVTGPVTLAD